MANYTVKQKKEEILKKYSSWQLQRVNNFTSFDFRSIEELPIKDFLAVLYLSNVQFNAPCFERRLALKGWQKIKSSENNGDFKIKGFERNVELKMSFPNKENKINIRQIRLWQNCDYIIAYCDSENEIPKHIVLFLTHEQMIEQVKKYGSPMHGTKKANSVNKNVEYGIAINKANLNNWKQFENIKLLNFMFS